MNTDKKVQTMTKELFPVPEIGKNMQSIML